MIALGAAVAGVVSLAAVVMGIIAALTTGGIGGYALGKPAAPPAVTAPAPLVPNPLPPVPTTR